MLSTKTRNTIIALVASFSFTASALVPAVSQAQQATTEKKDCTLTTPVGTKLQYKDGERVKIENVAGTTQTYECRNGSWVCVTRTGSSTSAFPTVVGATLGPAERGPAPVYRTRTTSARLLR